MRKMGLHNCLGMLCEDADKLLQYGKWARAAICLLHFRSQPQVNTNDALKYCIKFNTN